MLRRPPGTGQKLFLIGLCIFSIVMADAAEPVHSGGRSVSGAVFRDLPQTIDPSSRYLFYLHGRIIEDKGLRPESSRFGIYEYEDILAELAGRGFIVVSEPREHGTRVPVYARKVVGQVQTLLGQGVPPEYISVVGFSKGGGIAIEVSTLLPALPVNFVLLAACGRWIFQAENPPDLGGRVLSVREASDNIVGSCRQAFDSSTRIMESREIELHLGGGHGVFFRPVPQWFDPTVEWLLSPQVD